MKRDQGDMKGAVVLLDKAKSIALRWFTDKSLIYANILFSEGALFYINKNISKAKALFELSLNIFRTKLPNNHPRIGEVLNSVGGMLKEQGNTKQAKEFFTEAHAIFMNAFGENHQMTVMTNQNLKSC